MSPNQFPNGTPTAESRCVAMLMEHERKALGWDAEQAASLVGMRRQYWYDRVNNSKSFTLDHVVLMAEHTGEDVWTFIHRAHHTFGPLVHSELERLR